MRQWRALVFLGLLAGCGGPEYDVGEDRCPALVLSDGAVLSYDSGSSWNGDRIWSVEAFGDGRLVLNDTVNVSVPAERVARLVADIEATEVEDETDGCYWPSPGERLTDVSAATLILRDDPSARLWSFQAPASAPSEVHAALAVMDRFRQELLEAKVLPENDG